jgi:mRNA interferase YafQ
MFEIKYKTSFKKDYKKIKFQLRKLEKLNIVINLLINEKILPKNYKDHPLSGNYSQCRECHIEPNFLLIYKIEDDKIIFERLGSHSELFS